MSAERRPVCGRRDFLVRSLGAVAVVALPWGCGGVAMTPVVPRAGAIRLRPADHPALAVPGGSLRLAPAGFSSPVYVLAVDDGYVALSPICTHLGCTVGIEGPRLVCPCHGSTYDRRGRVLRGPAERSLRSFPADLAPDGTLVIRLETPDPLEARP